MLDKPRRTLRPDHQLFDEVRIVTIPRYKDSELSGDEWRISAEIQFMCKGKVMHTTSWRRDVKTAIAGIGGDYLKAGDMGREHMDYEEQFCDQEPCQEKPTVFYKMKHHYSREGRKSDPLWPTLRAFCQKHSRRGDCGLEDADINYEKL